MFTTLFFALLDPATGSLTYINGGNEPPIVIGPSGVKGHLNSTGPVVGIIPGVDFAVQGAHLEPGDLLLAFTDGVTEALNPERKIFTEERLLSVLDQPAPSAATLLAQRRHPREYRHR